MSRLLNARRPATRRAGCSAASERAGVVARLPGAHRRARASSCALRLPRRRGCAGAGEGDAGLIRAPLHGLPLAVKDIFDARPAHRDGLRFRWPPAARGCGGRRAVPRSGRAGDRQDRHHRARRNMTAGVTRNPFNPAHSPGGSSMLGRRGGRCHGAAGVGHADGRLDHPPGSLLRRGRHRQLRPRRARAEAERRFDGHGGRLSAARWPMRRCSPGAERRCALRTQAPPRRCASASCRGPTGPGGRPTSIACWDRARACARRRPRAARDASLPPGFADVAAVQATIQAAETAQALADEHRQHHRAAQRGAGGAARQGCAVDALTLLATAPDAERWRGEIDAHCSNADVLLAPSAVGERPSMQFTGDPIFCRPWSLLGLPCVFLPFATEFDRAAGGPATHRPPRRRSPVARRSAVGMDRLA